jgi:hypothetical protein
MFIRFSEIDPRDHIFKATGAITGLIGLGLFGFIFGLIGGALIDQLTADLRRKKRLKKFFIRPEEVKPDVPAAAASVVWYLCFNDPAKTELLSAALPEYFPDAPRCCIETLSELKDTDYGGTAAVFGAMADEEQKKSLSGLIAACGLNPAALRAFIEDPEGLTASILSAAGFSAEKSGNSSGSASEEDYALLGVSRKTSADEAKKVYYNLASHFHPDAVRELTAEQRKMSEDAFKRISEAYDRIRLNR